MKGKECQCHHQIADKLGNLCSLQKTINNARKLVQSGALGEPAPIQRNASPLAAPPLAGTAQPKGSH